MNYCSKVCLYLLFLWSPQLLAQTWACQPTYWVNLRASGPAVNEGNEPIFLVVIDSTHMQVRGKGSWLHESDFEITERPKNQILNSFQGRTPWGSQFALDPDKKRFFYSSTDSYIAISMTGTVTTMDNPDLELRRL